MLNQFDNLRVWCVVSIYLGINTAGWCWWMPPTGAPSRRGLCAGFGVSCPHVAATAASLTSKPAQGFYPRHITECSAGPRCPVSTLLTVASVTIMCPGVTWNLDHGQAAHLNILLKNGECWKLSSQPTIPNYLQKTHLINVKLLWKVHHQCIYCLAFQNEHWGSTEKIVDGFIGQSVQCPLA